MKTGKHNPNFVKDYQDLVEKENRKRIIVDMMKADEGLGLYDDLANNAGDLGLKQTERLKQLQNVKPKWV